MDVLTWSYTGKPNLYQNKQAHVVHIVNQIDYYPPTVPCHLRSTRMNAKNSCPFCDPLVLRLTRPAFKQLFKLALLQEFCFGLVSNSIRSFSMSCVLKHCLIAHWRQQHFRPNKALPKDVTPFITPVKPKRSFSRAIFDIFVGCVCLGLPYLLLDRHRQARIDEESGMRSATPLAVVGACTCLIVSFFSVAFASVHLGLIPPKAAIILSASVTFLSLPGLDSLARVAGFVAILFSTFSMVSTVVAVFWYKADLEQPIPRMGVEGLMTLSVCVSEL
jgi:hypothetical protein